MARDLPRTASRTHLAPAPRCRRHRPHRRRAGGVDARRDAVHDRPVDALSVDRRRCRLGRPAARLARGGDRRARAHRQAARASARSDTDDNRSIALDARRPLRALLVACSRTGPGARLPRAEPRRGAARHACSPGAIPAWRSCSTIAPSPTSPAGASSPGPDDIAELAQLAQRLLQVLGPARTAPLPAPERASSSASPTTCSSASGPSG